uniref:Uncharacterized protein n=1 Tax=Zea mays TaxID=4577 RepID=A0A804MBI0_MAIZE
MATASQPAAPTPNGYGGGILAGGDGVHGTARRQISLGHCEPVSQHCCCCTAVVRWGYCQSVARHPREQGSHHSSSQDMAVEWLHRNLSWSGPVQGTYS